MPPTVAESHGLQTLQTFSDLGGIVRVSRDPPPVDVVARTACGYCFNELHLVVSFGLWFPSRLVAFNAAQGLSLRRVERQTVNRAFLRSSRYSGRKERSSLPSSRKERGISSKHFVLLFVVSVPPYGVQCCRPDEGAAGLSVKSGNLQGGFNLLRGGRPLPLDTRVPSSPHSRRCHPPQLRLRAPWRKWYTPPRSPCSRP